ncbi:MAG TPA: lipid A biosynthesis lauroyl acyltransferase [Xanthobacteraceae bacterium]|nr:lipid A biosynthesis lauroyl acyltransferase [Xanthobacteraceae bacterium]
MIGSRPKKLLDATIGAVAVGLLRAVKRIRRERAANFAGAFMRKAGPLVPEHRLGRDNLRAAFPEKSAAEIEQILAGVWDNLGRVAAEFVHLNEFRVVEPGISLTDTVIVDTATLERARRIAADKATLSFACHTANWEIPAVVTHQVGVPSAVLYRRPNIAAVSDAIIKLRTGVMGQLVPTGLDAPVRLARLLQNGVHVGMLVDQHYTKGVEVQFFGRTCKANPLIALLARQLECPIYGLRAIRLPDRNRFRIDITDPIEPPRDADGRVDVQGTMQAITNVIEGWVREYPEQWLWLHRRWR